MVQLTVSRLPRAVSRALLLFLLASALILINTSRLGGAGIHEGVWDASSYSDRRGISHSTGYGGLGLFRKSISSWSNTIESPIVPILIRPNRARLNNTGSRSSAFARPANKGSSRIPVPGAPDKYELGPLPSLDEAFARLEPRLREVKDAVPTIPKEHELWNPVFAPYITEDNERRYHHLRTEWDEAKGGWVPAEKRYLFVTVCRQVAGILADWFAAWTVLADFLGPESMVFSLDEGGSDDGSAEIISSALREHLLLLGVPPENIHIRTRLPVLDWEAHHRIELLAQMRNAGMQPFYDSLPSGLTPDGHPWTAIIYYNDVYLSASHFLELMHQHFLQDADMTCAWDHAGRWFYDGWVGRDMSGDLYTPFPVKEEDKDLPQKVFINHPSTRERFDRLLPFQVFAGWNGIAVLSPTPFLPPYNIRFRRGATPPSGSDLTSADMECQQSESSFISWDFWKYGFGRIQVVPGVHACYGKEDAMLRGWLEFPMADEGHSEMIEWQDEPPRGIRCHDWPDKPGKGWWAWDTVRWVPPPSLTVPEKVAGQ